MVLLYEKYHSAKRVQKRIIDKDNFTYKHIIKVLEFYIDGKKIIDIGCGTGSLDFYLAQKGKKIVGIDVSQNAIDTAILNAKKFNLDKNIAFFVSNFPEQKIKGKFDTILCFEVIEHIQNEKKTVEEIFKLLKKNGNAIFSVPSQNAPLHKLGFAKNHDRAVGHLRRYTQESLTQLLKKQGFTILSRHKNEGLIRNFLFIHPFGGLIVKLANRFKFIADFITFIDNPFLILFGEAQIIVVVQKI